MIADLIKNNRSCRRFYQDHSVDTLILKEFVNLARLSASAANLQPLKYIISSDRKKNDSVFHSLAWAGYLNKWPGPEEGERPSAYIIILGDTSLSMNFGCDHGIAGQSILLGAREKGLAGCMIGAFNKKKLQDLFQISSELKIILVIAIGKPKEIIEIDTVGEDGDIKYYRDDNMVHHVPKRKLDEIIVGSY